LDPVIFSFELFGFSFALRWYGVLVMLGVVVGAFLAEKEVKRRGEDPEHVWNSLLWLLPTGVVGARLWYVVNATVGGSRYYLDAPIKIFAITEGGLHFFGGLLFGVVALYFYARKYGLDLWLFLDSVAPMTMIGQAVARPANFINQELYGPPTTLPWGIRIDAFHRLPEYNDLLRYPVETTRFHPTFAYEMIWNFAAAGLLLWAAQKLPERFKPGMVLAWWLVLAGSGRTFIELFRPDQPMISWLPFTTSQFVSILMALAGLILLMARNETISIPGLKFPDAYKIAPPLPHDAKK
jgi:phosphatidylglycerol:prolipoprotein diacylglycerol transferase